MLVLQSGSNSVNTHSCQSHYITDDISDLTDRLVIIGGTDETKCFTGAGIPVLSVFDKLNCNPMLVGGFQQLQYRMFEKSCLFKLNFLILSFLRSF